MIIHDRKLNEIFLFNVEHNALISPLTTKKFRIFIHTLFIAACYTLSCSLVLLQLVFFPLYLNFRLFYSNRLFNFSFSRFLNFTSSLLFRHFPDCQEQWVRMLVPGAILFASLLVEDGTIASFSRVLFVSFLFFFDIHANTETREIMPYFFYKNSMIDRRHCLL